MLLEHDLTLNNALSCYCENKNGNGEDNGISCGILDDKRGMVDGGFYKTTSCKPNEWCTGPSHLNDSVQIKNYAKDSLCSAGR